MKQITLNVADNTKMEVYICEPKNSPRGGIIVLQEAFGVNAHVKDILKRFAEEGYLAIAPELYHRTAPKGFTAGYGEFNLLGEHFGSVTVNNLQSDIEAAYFWLKDQGVSHIATVGHCLGGRVSFIANANTRAPLACAVSYYGGRIAPAHINLSEKQNSPVLFFWGMLDQHIPNEQVQEINQTLTFHHKKYTCVQFSDADHGFFCDERPSYNAVAAKLSWTLTLAFIQEHFKS